MPLSGIEGEIVQSVVKCFVGAGDSTPFLSLLHEYEAPDAVRGLVNSKVLQSYGNGPKAILLPTILAFHYCGDPSLLATAKSAVQIVVPAIRTLSRADWEFSKTYSLDSLLELSWVNTIPIPSHMALGLFLVRDFGNKILSSWIMSEQQTRVKTFRISQEIVAVKDVDHLWDEHIQKGIKAVEVNTETEPVIKEGKTLPSNIDVFISHSSADAVIAKELIGLLRTAIPGLPPEVIRCTSVPGYRLEGGAKTDEQLLSESLEAKVFIALISKQSLESTYVLFELGARWGSGKYFVPVVVAGMSTSQLKPPLSGRNAHSAGIDDHLFQLVDEVANKLGFQVAKPSVYAAQVKTLMRVSSEAATKTLTPARSADSRAENIRFVETRVINAHTGDGDGQIHESPQNLGDFKISVVCFRNEAIVGKSIQQPRVKAHVLYRSKDRKEITEAPRAVWLSEYGEEADFETGKKRCLIVFLLSNQDTLKKLWKETYTTSNSWMAGGPLFRIRDEPIPGDIAFVDVSLLVDEVCVVQATFEVQQRDRGKLPALIMDSILPAQD